MGAVELWEWFMRQERVLPAPTMRIGVSMSDAVGVETLS